MLLSAEKKPEDAILFNEIFAQLETLYPDNPFTALGKKEVVVIKKKDSETSGGEEEDGE